MIVCLYVECVCIHVEDTVSFPAIFPQAKKKKEAIVGMLENPERSGTERNETEPEVIDAQCGRRGGRTLHAPIHKGSNLGAG